METETIRAAHNLTIELSPTAWRLYNGSRDPENPDRLIALVEAHDDAVTCASAFARARHLPGALLIPADIARVVVGWAPESRNWHLGLLLAAQPDTGYQMRWCGLASWPSGHATEHATPARLAGQSLARIIDRPFHLVPPVREPPSPTGDTQPMQATAPMAPVTAGPAAVEQDIAPDAPPYRFDGWVMAATPGGYVLRRRSSWAVFQALRGIGLLGLAALFLILSIGAQTSGMAAVKPGWLPWVGLGVALVLIGQALAATGKLVTMTDVVIDTSRREVRRQGRFLGHARWRMPFDTVVYVLISQTPARPMGRKAHDQPMLTGQDAWLHLYDGSRFWEIADLGRVEGQTEYWEVVRRDHKHKGRRRLWLKYQDTPAHHAARRLADTLETEVWLDIR